MFISRYAKVALMISCVLLTLQYSCKEVRADGITPDDMLKPVNQDLEVMKKSGKLKALIVESNSSYFELDGNPMGHEYELLVRLANYLSLELELKVVSFKDDVLSQLKNGDVDIIASSINTNPIQKKSIHFTEVLYEMHQVLVQKKPDNWEQMKKKSLQKRLLQDRRELGDKTISVSYNNMYLDSIRALEKEIDAKVYIDTLSEAHTTNEMIAKVANGEREFTIADHRLASMHASYNPALAINVPITSGQEVAWAVRSNAPDFLKAVNQWITKEKNEKEYKVITDRYFDISGKKNRTIKKDFYDLENNQISEYDYLIKLGAKKIGWDWRLLAAQIYQESQFKPKARSSAGAGGLMQIMPKTARKLGVKNRNNPIESIIGGTTYLQQLYEKFEDIKDPVQRIKFTMASYNCGYGHVRDAQKLASHKGFNKNKWDYNVEIMILSLHFPQNHKKDFVKHGYVRGRETYNYVQRIFRRYEHYKEFIKL